MILISAGHNEKAKGAAHKGFSEFPETLNWAMLIHYYLQERGMASQVVPPGGLSGKVRYINEAHKTIGVSIAAEVHFNANGRGGSETLYCPGSIKGQAISNIVQAQMASLFPPDRGSKEGWYQMDLPGIVDYPGDVDGDEILDYFLRKTHCPAIILEPEFVCNFDLIETKREEACRLIADALITARESICNG
jgi:hypothetical protein